MQFTHFVSEHETEEPDLDIRHGDGVWAVHRSVYLFGREVAFVCAPAFLDRHGGALGAGDVQRLTMLQHFQMAAIGLNSLKPMACAALCRPTRSATATCR